MTTTRIIKLENGRGLTAEEVGALAGAATACKVLAFPTDTVYGLGSTALVKAAARRLYQIKERPSLKPLPVFVPSAQAAQRWAQWTPLAQALAERFWPGPLTLVLKPTAEGRLLTFAEYATIALRVPAHAELLRVIEASGVPWAQTSANRSGQPPLTDAAEVIRQFDGAVDWIVDAGPVAGAASTIVDATGSSPRLLREGRLSAADILSAGANR